jgi:AcrR family transcriptional regulator
MLMTRTKRKPEFVAAVRDAMLDAATRVFATKGYAAATMKDIALEANYTAPAFYNYFRGKEELFDALVERTTSELLSCFSEPPTPEQTLEQRVELLTRRLFGLVDRRGETLKMLDSLQNGNELTANTRSAMQQQCGAKVMERLGPWLGSAAAISNLGHAAGQLAVTFYLAVIRALHATWLNSHSPQRFEDQTDLAVDLFLHGFAGRHDKLDP